MSNTTMVVLESIALVAAVALYIATVIDVGIRRYNRYKQYGLIRESKER